MAAESDMAEMQARSERAQGKGGSALEDEKGSFNGAEGKKREGGRSNTEATQKQHGQTSFVQGEAATLTDDRQHRQHRGP